MNRILLSIILILTLFTGKALSQNVYPFKVATGRMLWHDNIDKQQKRLLNDKDSVKLSSDETINIEIADAMLRKVDELQEKIELDSGFTNQERIKYLRGLEFMLKGYNEHRNQRDYSITMAPALVNAFVECLELDRKGKSIEPVVEANSYGVGKILVDCFPFTPENPGLQPSRIVLLRKYCVLHPDNILPVLRNNPNLPSADSLITIAAHRDIHKLYDYAAGRNTLANRMRSHPDSLVRIVAKMANDKSGQLYFPFLDNILKGRITFDDISKVKDNDFNYYRLMVNTRIEYARRLLPPAYDTAVEMKALTNMMSRKAKDYFIREINALHTATDERVRFRRLEGLTPQELYYLIVLGEDEIYTSSYLGVYKRIFQRMANPRGDSLILSVNGDYFRKFIKMAAGYNELNDFLGRMDKDNATTIMKAFVMKLENTKELEESVDVADSYSSIMDKNPELARYILNEVKWNYDRNLKNDNKRGTVIYHLLDILFQSADSSKQVDLSAQLGIPPVYNVDFKTLADDSGRIVQQVFFYGDEDKDGQQSFENFKALFRNRAEWRITDHPEWIIIHSLRGKPVLIFANKPLYGENDPDEAAQKNMMDFMASNNFKPTIVIHRGHSYHLESTLGKLPPTAHIVVLGSCGGYNNLNEVLNISPDAHIISSKQVGTKTVNDPILQAINSTLVAGHNIDWISMWRELSARFRNDAGAREKFEDYIPPYKNLGAIFIKSYRQAMGENQ